ncbi:hypothetical protein B6U66_01115 [Candidatus Bathyarchaeota archaeon ex4484_135]|nr:MAG: hypothetical protein B6U66_01115 [Candidatus Bathyarchaeota archaeon ex4484_135]
MTWRSKMDHYYRLARSKGYRSRAAFKLLEAIEKFGLIRPGDTVLDLGCAPGSWLQVAREVVGPNGLVLGIDLRPVEPLGFGGPRGHKVRAAGGGRCCPFRYGTEPHGREGAGPGKADGVSQEGPQDSPIGPEAEREHHDKGISGPRPEGPAGQGQAVLQDGQALQA